MRFRTANAYLKFSQDVEKDDFKTFGTFDEVKLDDGEWVFDAEKVAKSLGIIKKIRKTVRFMKLLGGIG